MGPRDKPLRALWEQIQKKGSRTGLRQQAEGQEAELAHTGETPEPLKGCPALDAWEVTLIRDEEAGNRRALLGRNSFNRRQTSQFSRTMI